MQYTEGYYLDNRYRLESFVGSGSFGEVWVAKDTETDLDVAVKIYIAMDEKGLEEFKKEFQLSFELNHSNLLHANYLGVNSEDRRPYLVMPYCPDGSVSRYAGNMSEKDLWRFVHDVAAGLAYLHAQNPPIIHQDIKPDNILILKNGDYVITDFGISKQLRQSLRKSSISLNSAGAISYMGPERFSKNFQAVKASDVWSLGAAIYELAAGDVPFCGMGGSLQKQGADMPELPDQYSDELNAVCISCLAKETWDRPTAAQLRDYAAQIIAGRLDAERPWAYEVPLRESSIAPSPQEPEIPAEEAPKEPEAPAAKATAGLKRTVRNASQDTPASPAEGFSAPAPEDNAGVADNIDAPAKSGFVKTEAAVAQERPASPLALVIIAVVGLAAGAALGLLLL